MEIWHTCRLILSVKASGNTKSLVASGEKPEPAVIRQEEIVKAGVLVLELYNWQRFIRWLIRFSLKRIQMCKLYNKNYNEQRVLELDTSIFGSNRQISYIVNPSSIYICGHGMQQFNRLRRVLRLGVKLV